MLVAFSKSNDSPCFVKIAIFRQKQTSLTNRWGMFVFTAWRDSNRGHLARRRGRLATRGGPPAGGRIPPSPP